MIENYGHLFPVLENGIYLDHAAVTPIPRCAVSAGNNFLNQLSSLGHKNFPEWLDVRTKVKSQCAEILNADSTEIALIKNTSEGLLIVANGIDWQDGDNIILFENEFPANIYPWKNLQQYGVEIRFVKERDGAFHIEDIKAQIDNKTRLLAISFVEFSTGFKNDLNTIGQICKENNILFVVDAIQGMGAIPIDVKQWNIDFLSSGGHKWLMSGMGTGCFYCNKDSMKYLNKHNFGYGGVESPWDFLNYEQPANKTADCFEDGIFNVNGLFIMNASLNLLLQVGIEKINKHILELTSFLYDELTKKGYEILSPKEIENRSGIISFYSNKIKSEELYNLLLKNNIITSNRRDCVRVSPHFYINLDHINKLIEVLPEG